MTAPRRVAVAAAVAAGLGLLVYGLAGPADGRLERRSVRARPQPHPPAAPGLADPVDGPDVDPVGAWAARTDAVTRDCDLPVERACEGATCVALLHGPDLDHGLGWLDLAASSPRFVASTVLRDVGVDPGNLPCGAAIDALVTGGGVPMIELADGTELWCATDEAGDLALCDRAAAERYGVDGFGVPGVRRLSFR